MDKNNVNKCTVEPIRGSVVILAVKYILLLLIFDGIYLVLYYLLSLEFTLPFDIHHHLSVAFFALFTIKLILQVYTIVYVTLAWANEVYYLTDHQLVKRKGIVNTHEETFEFDNVRSFSINRSFLGDIFGFADLAITVLSEKEEKQLLLSGISNPYQYEKMLRECCQKLTIVEPEGRPK